MRTIAKFMVLAVGMTLTPLAFAQVPPGWNISWGVQGVPLSPALTAAIALMIGLVTYAFMRKRGIPGFMAVLAAVVFGGMTVNSDLSAIIINGYTITTEKGSHFVACGAPSLQIDTTVPAGVTLTRVEANFGAQPLGQQAVGPVPLLCAPGVKVTPAQGCQLYCVS
ncbi:MAG: hypothetical protein QG662_960 [Pseudomonadota bacterium]|nr:hypothetical protein [Pseudomonadota bacterium]